MSASLKPAVESLGIVKGHYECKYLDQTVDLNKNWWERAYTQE